MSNKELREKIENEMKLNNGFVSNNNYKLIDVKEKYCKLEGNITSTSLNPYGIAHGGYIFGLADTAAGIAARVTGRNAVTISSTINYIHKVKGNKIIAIAKCLKEGKTITNYKVLIEYFYITKKID